MEKVFRGNFSTASPGFSYPKTTLGLSTFYWVLIGGASGGILTIAIITGICKYKLHSRKREIDIVEQPTGGNTFVHNNIQINPGPKFKFGSSRKTKNYTQSHDDLYSLAK